VSTGTRRIYLVEINHPSYTPLQKTFPIKFCEILVPFKKVGTAWHYHIHEYFFEIMKLNMENLIHTLHW
jgi:hypothetical protein